MKGDGLAKLYDTLSVDELFRLRLKAWSRRDNADCDRLDRAAMLRQYGAYCSRLEASEVLTLSVIAELLPKLAKLQMVGALTPMVELLEGAAEDAAWMGYLDGYAAGWKAAGKRGEPPEVADDDLTAAAGRAYSLERRFSQALNGLASEMAGGARTPRDALAAFAAEELGAWVTGRRLEGLESAEGGRWSKGSRAAGEPTESAEARLGVPGVVRWQPSAARG